MLVCLLNDLLAVAVASGRPQPQVRWLVNGLLVDNQYEHNSGDVIENRLLWPSVQRTDLNSVFTCQALNTQLDKPKEKSFLLDMHCKFAGKLLVVFAFFFLFFAFRRVQTCARSGRVSSKGNERKLKRLVTKRTGVGSCWPLSAQRR